jgi:hypothetical protein
LKAPLRGTTSSAAEGAAQSTAESASASAEDSSAARAADEPSEEPSQESNPEQESDDCETAGQPHSFAGSTRVLLADGTTKAIDKVRVGDKVKNAVPGNAGTEVHTVQRVIVTTTNHDFVDLTVTTKRPGKAARTAVAAAAGLAALAGTATLTTTFHHPFYDRTQAAFVEAANLQPGDDLQTTSGPATVVEKRTYHTTATTYDLTINGLHTYYVLAGTTPVLVHNVDLGELNSCPVSPTTHWADVSVHESNGDVVQNYAVRSGAQRPSEAAVGRGGETLSHTENRVARMSGGVPSYGQRIVGDDEFFLENPVPENGHVVIQGTRPPCSSCQGAMNRAAEDTASTFTYFWEEEGGVRVWQSTK